MLIFRRGFESSSIEFRADVIELKAYSNSIELELYLLELEYIEFDRVSIEFPKHTPLPTQLPHKISRTPWTLSDPSQFVLHHQQTMQTPPGNTLRLFPI